MKETINEVINNYYEREAEKSGAGRYFKKEFVTEEMLKDKHFKREILDACKKFLDTKGTTNVKG
jgi:hypothetical protein